MKNMENGILKTDAIGNINLGLNNSNLMTALLSNCTIRRKIFFINYQTMYMHNDVLL